MLTLNLHSPAPDSAPGVNENEKHAATSEPKPDHRPGQQRDRRQGGEHRGQCFEQIRTDARYRSRGRIRLLRQKLERP